MSNQQMDYYSILEKSKLLLLERSCQFQIQLSLVSDVWVKYSIKMLLENN